jgi:ribosome-associated protein
LNAGPSSEPSEEAAAHGRPRVLVVDSRVQIPVDELHFSFVRSSGPGGQNVNKVSTKAVMRWSPKRAASLPDDVQARFMKRFRSRITRDGDVVITSQRFRDQRRNAGDCIEKLRQMLAEVVSPPARRKRTKPSRSSHERRLQQKRARAVRKLQRRIRLRVGD